MIPDEHSIRQLQSDLKTFAGETRKRLDEIGKRIAVSQQKVVIDLSSEKKPTKTELGEHTNNRSNVTAENNRSNCSVVNPVKHNSDYQLDAIKRRLAERLRNTSSEM